ncbi:fatty acyl-CoA reductase wat isoform X1 [Diachasma alloeum]|uniref:fatty acyl-CoA reductase wat isoform X1 n=1 Tax=Diachasma alloeum TaxID=454923 RepID=UPI00073845CE|nr:fatty acyl-CoA reductase wat isoform X1 [Diachasma alloeum]
MLLENPVPGYVNDASGVYDNRLDMNENNNNVTNRINEDGGIMRTAIQDFYSGQNVFITGGTGFLGKTLVEKLLRSCPDVSTIYLLVRSKKGHNVVDRVDDLFNEPIFEHLKKNSPKFRHKVVAVAGDCESPNLGLSESNRDLLIQEVSIVFHSAATVRFDEKLRVSTAINVGGTLAVLNLCKEMKKLKAMIHVSTAYSNCHLDTIEESFCSHPMQYEDLKTVVNTLSDDAVNDVLPRILQNWPNTYTYTKALAEQVVRQKSKDLPVGIFRPGIIISCAEEPLPGWIDNYYGPTGGVAAAQLGILKSVHYKPDIEANVVPVDFTVNGLIASAWDVATRPDRRNDKTLIYNYVSTVDAPVLWADYYDYCLAGAREFPILQSKWYLTFSPKASSLSHSLSVLFLHLVPAMILDFFLVCTGNKPRTYKMVTKIFKYLSVVQEFTMRNWTYKTDNVQQLWNRLDAKDKQNFKFSLKEFDWRNYFRNYLMGVKIYLFKEDLSTLEASRKRAQRLLWLHQGTKTFFGLIMMWMVWKLFTPFI